MRTDDYTAFRYLISVEGTKLKADVTDFIQSVVYEEGENVASKIELDVANPDFRFSESKVFAEGNAVDLWMGYVGKPLGFMGRGIIVKPNPTFPRSGVPRFRVTAHDVSRKLMNVGKDDKGKTYKKKKDSAIAEEIFKEIEVSPFVVATKGLKTRTRKKGDSRWLFLQRLAKLNGYSVNIRYDPTKGTHLGWFGPADGEEQEEKYKFS
jgi:phage protein D